MMAHGYAEREDVTMKNILVALDGSESASRALAMASDLAMRYGAVLASGSRVAAPHGGIRGVEGIRPGRARRPSGGRGDVRRGAIHRRRRTGGCGRHGVVHSPKTSVLAGDPDERLLEYAREQAVDLVVVGRRGVGQIRGLLMGSVSWKVNSLAECPVLTVR